MKLGDTYNFFKKAFLLYVGRLFLRECNSESTRMWIDYS